MIESILMSLGGDEPLSPLGPGPQELIGGNETAGFFGETTTNELITGNALATLINLRTGTFQNNTSPWLKFWIDGKVVYIARRSYSHTAQWDQINAANAVYGDRIVEINRYRFRIRLPKGLNPDTSVPFTTGHDAQSSWNSEWNRLMYRVSVDNPKYPKTSQVGPNWANYSDSNLNIASGNGSDSWCQETVPGHPTLRVRRGWLSVSTLSGGDSALYASNGWRPVLELVP